MVRLLFVFLFLITVTLSCDIDQAGDDEVLATAFGNKLFKQDILPFRSTKLNPVDSQSMISRQIDSWLMEEMLYKESKSKVNSKKSIDKLVANYRKSLFIHELEKLQLAANLDTTITAAELDTFYAHHKADFQLDEAIVKLLFAKVPEGYNNEELKTLWQTENLPALQVYVQARNGLELLEPEKWHYLSEISNIAPLELIDQIDFTKKETYSITDKGQHFLIKVLDYVKPTELAPKSFALPYIKERLLRDRSKNLLNSWKKELFQNNIKSKDISITSTNSAQQ